MKTIENDVLVVLSTLEISGKSVMITRQLNRKLYLAVNKVLEHIGGKWNRKIKAHVFDTDPTGRLEAVIESGALDPKIKTGYFPTPPEIVNKMIELADLGAKQRILEPSAGQGHIADKIVKHLVEKHIQKTTVLVCENLPENVHILEEKGYVVEGNFLKFSDKCQKNGTKFDRIIMNPPFERQADINHVTTAYNLLAYGGILVTIMSAGVTFKENEKTTTFRENVIEPHQTHIEQLPVGTFKESGTMVHTIMLRLKK